MANSKPDARRVARNVIGNFATYLGCSIGMGSLVAAFQFVSLAPRAPDFARGMVFEFNNHGSTLYFTAHQNLVVWGGLFGGILLFFFAFLVLPKRDVIHRRGFLSWRITFKPDDPEGVRYWGALAGLAVGVLVVGALDPTLLGWCLGQIQKTVR